jgi:hypothetical protein
VPVRAGLIRWPFGLFMFVPGLIGATGKPRLPTDPPAPALLHGHQNR